MVTWRQQSLEVGSLQYKVGESGLLLVMLSQKPIISIISQ